jgi:predicted membrane protein DUF2079
MKPPWTFGPVGQAQPWDRWDRRALLAAAAIAAWVFLVKLKAFLDLAFTSDLFIQTQLARSWLEGRFLEDNCYGRHLAVHTYFFLPVLGLLAKPLGAPGLFIALAIAVGASAFLAHRILRLLEVRGPIALAAGVGLVSLPISVWVFGDGLGFHVDLMLPPLGLGLFYALLRRRLLASLLLTLLVCSVKEDAPIVAAVVAMVVIFETWLGTRSWHRAGLASLGLAVALLPLLFFIKGTQAQAHYSVDHFALLTGSTGGAVTGIGSLLRFVGASASSWIVFSLKQLWPLLFLGATLGGLLLRPWLAPVGFVTTAVAWLMGGVAALPHQDLHWSNRAVSPLVFCWCVTLIVFASLVRWGDVLDARRRQRLARLCAGVLVVSLIVQLRFATSAWDAIDLGIFRASPYTAAERKQANALFATYRREGRPEEPVVASPSLFRYAHDRNMFWLDRLQGRPRPIWILQDGEWTFTDFGLRSEDYSIVGQSGRFVLLKRIAN